MEAPREDVEMGNDEDEKQMEAEVPRVRRIPRVEKNKNVKIQDMLCTGIGVLLVSRVEELVDNIEVNCWRKRNEKKRLRLLLFITVS